MMKMSDNKRVQALIDEHAALRALGKQLDEVNGNSRFATLSTGYYQDSKKIIEYKSNPISPEHITGLITTLALAGSQHVALLLEEVEDQLIGLGVDVGK